MGQKRQDFTKGLLLHKGTSEAPWKALMSSTTQWRWRQPEEGDTNIHIPQSIFYCEIFSYWLFQAATISLKTTKTISTYFIEAAALKSQHLVTSRTMMDKWDVVRPNCIMSCVVPQNTILHGNMRFKTSEGKPYVKTRLGVKLQGLEKEAVETCWWNGEREGTWCRSNATLNLTVTSLQGHQSLPIHCGPSPLRSEANEAYHKVNSTYSHHCSLNQTSILYWGHTGKISTKWTKISLKLSERCYWFFLRSEIIQSSWTI